MRLKYTLIVAGLVCLCTSSGLIAQDTLRIEEAVQKGLEKNFAIRIARNNAEIAGNNNTLGNAGFLPVLTADGTLNKRIEDS